MNICENSILTAILGDSMGVPYEFPNKMIELHSPDDYLTSSKKRIGGRYFPTVMNCEAGEYSDVQLKTVKMPVKYVQPT